MTERLADARHRRGAGIPAFARLVAEPHPVRLVSGARRIP